MSAEPTQLHLQFFGNPQILQDGAPVTGFITRKAQALFIYLAVTACPHTRETLAGMFWPDMPETDAKTNLRKALSNLRRLLPQYLRITRQEVAFNPDSPYSLDVARFIAAVENINPAQLTSQTAAQLAGAVALYRGEFLAGFYLKDSLAFSEWALVWREQLREQAIQGLHALAGWHADRRQYPPAIDYLKQLLALDPWREEAHRQLMLALARSGQRSAALAQYQNCCRVLKAELGVTPLPETTTLYERILALNPDRRHNLPAQPTPFVGRRRELAEIARLSANSDCRLLTFAGMGGVGKTRLAIEAARRQDGNFLDGLYFVPLASATNRNDLIQAIAAAIGFTFHDQGQPREQLLNHLHSREYLLLLDNFEHLSAGDAVLNDILTRAPQVKLWVTSRRRLTLPWEWLFEVTGLAYPANELENIEQYDAVQLFIRCARRVWPDFRLTDDDKPWLARLCRLLEGLPLGLELAAAWTRALSVAEIYRQVETGPDFLAASGSHLPERHRSLRAVLWRSWQRLGREEQQSYQRLAIFQGSFDRPAAEQIAGTSPMLLAGLLDKSLLQRIGDYRYDLHEMWRQFLLDQLTRQPAEYHRIQRDHSRYYLNFLQNPANTARLEPEFNNLWAGWQWAVAHGNAADIETYVEGLAKFLEARNRFQEVVTLFEQALERLLPEESGSSIETTTKIKTLALTPSLARLPSPTGRGVGGEGLFSAEELQEIQQQKLPVSPFKYAVWQRRMGEACFKLGRLPESKAYHLQALTLQKQPMPTAPLKLGASLTGHLGQQIWHRLRPVRRVKPPPAVEASMLEAARAYERLGQIYFFAGRPAEGIYTALRGLNLAEAASPSPELARLYANMGLAMGLVPLHPLARRYLALALTAAQHINHRPSLAWALELGSIYYSGVGAWTQVEQMATRAVDLNKQLGDMRHWEECIVMLAHRAHLLGQFQDSVEMWHELYVSALRRGDVQAQRWALTGQAENLLPLGRTNEAADWLELALALPVEITDTTTDISGYGLLAAARLRQGQLEAAETAAEKARSLIIQSSPTAFSSLEGYAATAEVWLGLWEATGQPRFKAAAQQTVKALRGFARVFPIARPRAWLCQGLYYRLAGKPRRARAVWRKSLKAARQFGMAYEMGLTHTAIGRNLPANDPARLDHLNQAGQIFTRLNIDPQKVIL